MLLGSIHSEAICGIRSYQSERLHSSHPFTSQSSHALRSFPLQHLGRPGRSAMHSSIHRTVLALTTTSRVNIMPVYPLLQPDPIVLSWETIPVLVKIHGRATNWLSIESKQTPKPSSVGPGWKLFQYKTSLPQLH